MLFYVLFVYKHRNIILTIFSYESEGEWQKSTVERVKREWDCLSIIKIIKKQLIEFIYIAMLCVFGKMNNFYCSCQYRIEKGFLFKSYSSKLSLILHFILFILFYSLPDERKTFFISFLIFIFMNFFISPLIIDFIVDYLCSEMSLGDIKIKLSSWLWLLSLCSGFLWVKYNFSCINDLFFSLRNF